MGLFDKLKDKATKTVADQMDNLKSKDIGGKNIGDLIKPLEDTTNNIMTNHKEGKKEQVLTLPVKKPFSSQLGSISIRRDINNYFYLSNKYDPQSPRYKFERFDWGGSSFTEETITKGDIKTKGRMGQTLVGAAVAGPVGALVGASGKRKSKVDTTSKTTTTENGSEGTIYLRNVSDSSIKEVKVFLVSSEAENLERFIANVNYETQEVEVPELDPMAELTRLKEMLDMELITQEDFDSKKKQILGL